MQWLVFALVKSNQANPLHFLGAAHARTPVEAAKQKTASRGEYVVMDLDYTEIHKFTLKLEAM